MKYRLLLLSAILFAVIHCSLLQATEIAINKICLVENDLSARTKPRKDFNGTNCALAKVYLPLAGVRFQGNIIGNSDYYGGEYWVYLTEGTKEIRVVIPGQLPTNISFATSGIGPVSSGRVYEVYFCSSSESKEQYTIEDYQDDIKCRENLISIHRYDDAIKSFSNLRDSISSFADKSILKSVDERINFCKRQLSFKSIGVSEVGNLSYGRIGIKKDDKYGFADSIGNVIVYPQFENAIDYNNGVAWIKKNGLWGNINLDGSVNIPFSYEVIVLIKDNDNSGSRWIQVFDGNSVGIVDYVNGKTIHPFRYSWDGSSARFFSNTFDGFVLGGSIGECSEEESSYFLLRDKKYNVLELFDKSDCSSNGTLGKGINYVKPITSNLFMTERLYKKIKSYSINSYGIVDNMGREILDCNYHLDKITGSDEFILVSPIKTTKEHWWNSDSRIFSLKTREYISEQTISSVDRIWNNWFVANSRYSDYKDPYIILMNKHTGESVDFKDGIGRIFDIPGLDDTLLLKSYVFSKWYVFRKNGSIVELPTSEYSYYMKDRPLFQFGVQPILKKGKWGFVNLNGEICIEPIYDQVSFFQKNQGCLTSEVSIGDETFYIDINGHRIEK